MRNIGTRYAVYFGLLVACMLAATVALTGVLGARLATELSRQMVKAFAEAATVNDERALRKSVGYLSSRLFNDAHGLDISGLNAEIRQVRGWLPVDSFLVVDREARIMTDGTRANVRLGQLVALPPALASGQPVVRRIAGGTEVFFTIRYGEEVAGHAAVTLSDASLRASLASLEEHADRVRRSLRGVMLAAGLGALAVVAAIAFALAWRLSMSLSRPVSEMIEAAKQYAAGNLDHRLAVRSSDELGELARSLNTMAGDLKKTHRLLAKSQEMAALGSWEWNDSQPEVLLSEGAWRILGVDPPSFVPNFDNLLACVEPADSRRAADVVGSAEGRPVRLELRIRRPGGAVRIVQVQGEPMTHAGVTTGYFGTIQDVTEQRDVERKLAHLASYDSLTGLPNRHLFRDRLHHAMQAAARRDRSVALMFLDLDRFKSVNDVLGHAAGDELLRAVSGRLSAAVGPSDTVARLGGDEFTVIVEDVQDAASVAELANRLLASLSRPLELHGRTVHPSGSIGITLYPADGDEIGALLRHADTAMYLAKEQGRATFRFFTRELDHRVSARLTLEERLRAAVAARAFELHFQPVVRIADGALIGAEALLRMRTAEGLMRPRDFLDVLDDTGVICDATDWVIGQACVEARRWRESGVGELRVSVNLSARQLQPGIAASTQKRIDEARLAPSSLEIEITEATLADGEPQREVLRELACLGVRIAIDDFGTGLSSLAQLRRYSVDTLKIAFGFISVAAAEAAGDGEAETADRRLERIAGDVAGSVDRISEDGALITGAIIAFARRLAIETVGEGIETRSQLDALRSLGCDAAQGHLIAQPLPADDFLRWAKLHRRVDFNRLGHEAQPLAGIRAPA